MSDVIQTYAELLAQLDELQHAADTSNAEHRDRIRFYKRCAGVLTFLSIIALIGVSVLVALPFYTRRNVEPIFAVFVSFNMAIDMAMWLYIVVALMRLISYTASLATFTEQVRHMRELVTLHAANALKLQTAIGALNAKMNALKEDAARLLSRSRTPYGKQARTEFKLKQLKALRGNYMAEHDTPPGWTWACNQIKIDTTTVIEHEPELSKNWDDPNYPPK